MGRLARERVRLPVVYPAGRGHVPDASADEPKEKCGVFGVWGRADGAQLSYLGLFAQQHRGQESAGIAVTEHGRIRAHTGMGLVADVFGPAELAPLTSDDVVGAIGHNRYSTFGGSEACNAQPIVQSYAKGQVALGHNGNLVNGSALRHWFEARGHIFHTTSDSEVIVHLLASPEQQKTGDALAAALRRLQGAFSLVVLFPDRIEAARDPWGWRPLVLGEMPDGAPVVASETVTLEVVGARIVREIEPGEIVTLSDAGVESRRFADPAPRLARCVFEHVYFASPASTIFGDNVQIVRERLGAQLAKESPCEGADWVMPMPDSGRSAASGFARASGIMYREGIVPNRYVGRTFIKPTQEARKAAVRLKLNVIHEIVDGKKLVVVDDSIVRGTTTREKMRQLYEAGAKEIHLRISCPPIRHPCHFGVDFATRDELVATGRTVEQIRDFLGVDSLEFLSLEGLLSCVKHPADSYCHACYSGKYPIDLEHPVVGDVLDAEAGRLFA